MQCSYADPADPGTRYRQDSSVVNSVTLVLYLDGGLRTVKSGFEIVPFLRSDCAERPDPAFPLGAYPGWEVRGRETPVAAAPQPAPAPSAKDAKRMSVMFLTWYLPQRLKVDLPPGDIIDRLHQFILDYEAVEVTPAEVAASWDAHRTELKAAGYSDADLDFSLGASPERNDGRIERDLHWAKYVAAHGEIAEGDPLLKWVRTYMLARRDLLQQL